MRGVRGPGAGISRRHFHNIQMRGEGETEARNCVPWGTERYIFGGGRRGRGTGRRWRVRERRGMPRHGVAGWHIYRRPRHLQPGPRHPHRALFCPFVSPIRRQPSSPPGSPTRSTLPILATSLSSPPLFGGPRPNAPKRPPRPRPRGWHIGRYEFFGESIAGGGGREESWWRCRGVSCNPHLPIPDVNDCHAANFSQFWKVDAASKVFNSIDRCVSMLGYLIVKLKVRCFLKKSADIGLYEKNYKYLTFFSKKDTDLSISQRFLIRGSRSRLDSHSIL